MINLNIFEINQKKIGNMNPTYFIAEAGLNHNGQIDIAKKMIDDAYNACLLYTSPSPRDRG